MDSKSQISILIGKVKSLKKYNRNLQKELAFVENNKNNTGGGMEKKNREKQVIKKKILNFVEATGNERLMNL